MKHLFTAALLLIATTFCMQARAQKISEADLKVTGKVYQDMMAAFGKLDADAVANYYTENGTHISPEGQIVTGRTTLKAYYQKLFEMFKTLPKPDKTDINPGNWSSRYLGADVILVTYINEQTRHYGNKAEKEVFAMSVVLKKTKDSWLCDQVTMTPVRPMH
jgi:uncharacterized protein (TIGR02246 family)